MSRVTLTLATAVLAAVVTSPAQAVEVYLFKGAGDFSFINKNMHFSRGLDRIAEQLNKEGIRAEVRGFAQTGEALRMIKKRRPKSVAFVGHSMGALASMSMARQMKSLGIEVAYVGTLDIPGPIGAAGSNVQWAENYFSITPIYGLLTNASSHRKAKNIHVFGTHTLMDDTKKVRNGVLSAIRTIHASEGGSQEVAPAETPETLTVENKKPAEAPEPVVVAKRLPKIDEDVTSSDQGFALAKPVRASQFDQRIMAAHDLKPTKPKKLEKVAIVQEDPSDLMPINLLATPAVAAFSSPVKQPEAIQTSHAAIHQPSVEQQPGYIAPSTHKAEEPGSIFNRGRITSVGRKLVSRISGMLSRNGRQHDRKPVEEIESQR